MKIINAAEQRREQGFTVVELIIAMSLFVLITSTAYSSLMQILRANKSLDDERDVSMIANAILSRMTREIQLSTSYANLIAPIDEPQKRYPPSVHMIGVSNSLREGRHGDTITFVANEAGQYVPDGQTHTGVVQITYRVEPVPPDENPNEEDIYYLIRDEVPDVHPVDKAHSLRMTFPITKRLVSLSFQYYDDDDEEWTDEWDESKAKLPTIIHFTLQVRSPAGKVHTYTSDIAVRRP